MRSKKTIAKIVRPKPVSEVVLERLRADIVNNQFALGEKISEGQLSELYQVTKAPIRSAYIRLEAEGLIEIRAQSGTFVFKPTPQELQALSELRTALELEAISLAMQRSLRTLQRSVGKIYDEMVDCARRGAIDEYQKLDTRLHLLFVESAGSPFLAETFVSKVNSRFAALRTRFSQQPQHVEHSLNEHKGLRDAISANDVEAVRKLLRQHIGYSEVYYAGLMEE
ncbi:GntR family transcriptional regulator [Brucella pseudintermedia]|uniref:GntR family transcriptional regulator n=1 Tax=Brucella pseudintermedia TaxID=370111 RepID=UPI00320BABE7